MSLSTWIRTFIPSEVSTYLHPHKPKRLTVWPSDPLDHSIRKWSGLTAARLAHHGLTLKNGDPTYPPYIQDSTGRLLPIDMTSCALCHAHYTKESGCGSCPLFQRLGKPCDDGPDSPYEIFAKTGNPLPMLRLLRSIYRKLHPKSKLPVPPPSAPEPAPLTPLEHHCLSCPCLRKDQFELREQWPNPLGPDSMPPTWRGCSECYRSHFE